jgi:hypothetical protein
VRLQRAFSKSLYNRRKCHPEQSEGSRAPRQIACGLSISQVELRRALEHGIQVFIFIERSVHAEFSTYQLNKDNHEVKYRFADDSRVYEFIESLYKLPHNNPIAAFETAQDITDYLLPMGGNVSTIPSGTEAALGNQDSGRNEVSSQHAPAACQFPN